MRRTVVALITAALAFTLVGCGGGAEEPAEAPAETPAETPAAPAAPAQPEYMTDRSANDNDLEPVAFPSFVTTETPAVIADKLEAGRPMLILFYDPAQDVTKTLRAEVDAVVGDYRGLIELVTFNVGGLSDSAPTKQAVTYATELGVATTPYLIAVDGNGFITWRWKGYVDRAYIKREVERATR